MAWFLPAVATLVGGALSYSAAKKSANAQKDATASQSAAMAAQQAAENRKLDMIQKHIDEASEMQKKYQPMSDAWTNEYLNWLINSPDLTYNAQRSRMEGDIMSSQNRMASLLGQRGLNTSGVQSGVGGANNTRMALQRAALLGQLEAGRHDRLGERLGIGSQVTQGLFNNAMNLKSGAIGSQLGLNSQIPYMMQNQAQNYMNQAQSYGGMAQAGGQLLGTGLNYFMQPQMTQAPTAQAPVQSYMPLISQFDSFKLGNNNPMQLMGR
jgi:hypothetical protein